MAPAVSWSQLWPMRPEEKLRVWVQGMWKMFFLLGKEMMTG